MSISNSLPLTPHAKTGLGLRVEYYQEILLTLPSLDFLEIHSENYFGEGGKPLYYLRQIAQHYPLSFHGVGLSLGSWDDLNFTHLKLLKKLIQEFSPILVSEHLSWSSINSHYANDLLPLPYTDEALDLLTIHIQQTQDFLQQPILIENISQYLEFEHSTIPEYEFIAELIRRTGCALLLDVNNLYINSINLGWDPNRYLMQLPINCIAEIHLAGFTKNKIAEDRFILIDTHNQRVCADVWELFKKAIKRFGNVLSLVEWDKDYPPLNVLIEEVTLAKQILKKEESSVFIA